MSELMPIRVQDIEPNPRNPRKKFNDAALEELAASIREVGILQPLVVVPLGGTGKAGRYRLLCGERRWRAAQLAGIESVPAIIEDGLTPEQEDQVMLIENLQRQDLDPLEEARALKALIKEHGWKQVDLAGKLGISQAQIANRIRLLDLPQDVQENISRGILSVAHGKILAGLKRWPELQSEIAKEAVQCKYTIRELDQAINYAVVRTGMLLERAEFDTTKCEVCKDRVTIKYPAWSDQKRPWCMRPECFNSKQAEAVNKRKKELKAKLAANDGERTPLNIADLVEENVEFVDLSLSHLKEVINDAECKKCKDCRDVLDYDGSTKPVCLNPSCVDKQKASAARAQTKAENARAQEKIKTAALEIKQAVTEFIDPVVIDLVKQSRAVWKKETKDHTDEKPLIDRESVLTLNGLLAYWNTKNEICKEATSMPRQLGDTKVFIPEQDVEFEGYEPYTYSGKYDTITVTDGRLVIKNNNGSVKDLPPALPVYYRIFATQYVGSKYVEQIVGIRTPSRTIIVYGHDSVIMRKNLFDRWIKLVEELPGVGTLDEIKNGGVKS
ncbi:MAG: ParB/RepB/Spo0J family partition protein [Peptococcaceae bacterium]|nr:ParB/RepB/Spo0J family partition protein [Peptococcaceae bacterium]